MLEVLNKMQDVQKFIELLQAKGIDLSGFDTTQLRTPGKVLKTMLNGKKSRIMPRGMRYRAGTIKRSIGGVN